MGILVTKASNFFFLA